MPKKILKTTPKTSVRIWEPALRKLNKKMGDACLRRDAYLRNVLEAELEHLDQEVSIPNSQESHDYVTEQLGRLDRKFVSLALPQELTAQLNNICDRKRIVRDAFFNRLLLLLAAAPSDIDNLFFRDADGNWRQDVWVEHRNESPFFENGFAPLAPIIDPFWGIRLGLEMLADSDPLEDYVEPTTGRTIRITRGITGEPQPKRSVYTTVFDWGDPNGRNLLGLNCYLPDSVIPEHPARAAAMPATDALLTEL